MTTRRQRSQARVRARIEERQSAVAIADAVAEAEKQSPAPSDDNNDNGHTIEEATEEERQRIGEELLRNVVLTPSEVALLLRLDVTTVLRMGLDGVLPQVKIARKTRFLRRDVLFYLRDVSNVDKHPERWKTDASGAA
jgi:hypothetical protein